VNGAVNRTLVATPVAALAFATMLMLAAVSVRNGIVADDTLRLWAGASTAADGQVPIGKIVAAYPTLPFLTTTLVAWLSPVGTPAPAVIAAVLYSVVCAFCLMSFLKVGMPPLVAGVATILIAVHPALLRAVIAGPAEMFLALLLMMFCSALYDLRARTGTSEVMAVGLTLMGLAFAHPLGAAVAFSATPFLALAVQPLVVASSALIVVAVLVFPTVFMLLSFAYVSWVFPGDGWSFFASPTQSLSLWSVAVARMFGDGITRVAALDASLAMGAALAFGAPIAVMMLVLAWRRRPLVVPAAVFIATLIAATAICVASGWFGDPTAIAVAAPMLAAVVVIRVPLVRERMIVTLAFLLLGWVGGFVGLALVDPLTVNRLHASLDPSAAERLDTIAAGGASVDYEGVLADTDNAPALVLGRGQARGLLGPSSEPFALALLLTRIDTPLIAVPDPRTPAGFNDRLNRSFPALFRDGAAGYRLIYQNNTWRLFAKLQIAQESKK
jgi:hypothetical protein